jgi:23S rRNA pseudouridine1911/1915/1917 synthase
MKTHTIIVSPENESLRVDAFLAQFASNAKLGISRTAIKLSIEKGQVSVNSVVCASAHHKVKAGDILQLAVGETQEKDILAEDIALDVVYEDDDIAVINKQAGIVVHPAPGNVEHTLVNALMHRFRTLSDVNPGRPGIVHRLDKETSGLLIIAKNNHAHLSLSAQFAEHSIERTYYAIVRGKVEFDHQVIEVPIGRHKIRRKEMAVSFSENAKGAKTRYKTLKRTDTYSLLELHPFTGRTHQLRVHCAYIGHPILGDTKYGYKTDFSRLALHAKTLGIIHPRTGKYLEFTSDLPAEFDAFIKVHFR